MNQLKFRRITFHKHKENRITLKKTPTPLRTYNKNLNNMSQHDFTRYSFSTTTQHNSSKKKGNPTITTDTPPSKQQQ